MTPPPQPPVGAEGQQQKPSPDPPGDASPGQSSSKSRRLHRPDWEAGSRRVQKAAARGGGAEGPAGRRGAWGCFARQVFPQALGSRPTPPSRVAPLWAELCTRPSPGSRGEVTCQGPGHLPSAAQSAHLRGGDCCCRVGPLGGPCRAPRERSESFCYGSLRQGVMASLLFWSRVHEVRPARGPCDGACGVVMLCPRHCAARGARCLSAPWGVSAGLVPTEPRGV